MVYTWSTESTRVTQEFSSSHKGIDIGAKIPSFKTAMMESYLGALLKRSYKLQNFLHAPV